MKENEEIEITKNTTLKEMVNRLKENYKGKNPKLVKIELTFRLKNGNIEKVSNTHYTYEEYNKITKVKIQALDKIRELETILKTKM